MGKLLRVNLSSKQVSTETIPEQVVKDYGGGRGLGIRYLYQEVKRGVDPLGPENKLIFAAGALGGTPAQCCSRWLVITKNPLTGGYGRACAGGDFGACLRFAGFDFIIVEGKAEKPVYLYVESYTQEIRDAAQLWGKNTEETQKILQDDHGDYTRVACIGPAGERLVRFASINTTNRRTAARCGVGTVMGAKNLKAIAINAERQPPLADPAAFQKLVDERDKVFKESPEAQHWGQWGTSSSIDLFHTMGLTPVRNFQEGQLKGIENLTGRSYAAIKTGQFGCHSCMMKCGQSHRVSDGFYSGIESEGPEYETIWALGANLAITDIGATIATDALCDLLGLDTVGMGNVAGFAMELYERGILTKADTGGLELTWGNHHALVELINKVARREGIGDILGEGVKRAAERIGKGTERYAMHCKGMELSGYEPRAAKAQGLSYATSNIGGSHNYGYAQQEVFGSPIPRPVDRFADEGKGDITAWNQKTTAMREVAILCSFANRYMPPDVIARLLSAATGIPELGDVKHLMKMGERILCLERAFNAREGFRRKDDALPKRMLTEPLLNAGPSTGQVIRKFDTLLDEYYGALGYDSQGIPTPSKLTELGLDFVIGDLAGASGKR